MADERRYCEVCKSTMVEEKFYKRHGKIPSNLPCKKCLAMRIQPRSQNTVLPVLEMIDVPYVPHLWNALVSRFERNDDAAKKGKINQTILGRYLQTMNLNKYATMSYADTENFLNNYGDEQKSIISDLTMRIKNYVSQGYSREETLKLLIKEEVSEDVDQDLISNEQRKRLRQKWGQTHSDEDLYSLEVFYEEMIATYDIMTPTHEDQLMQIAKLKVQMHNLLNSGDLKGYSGVSNAYDRMMKSAKFSAASEDKVEDEISSVAEIAKMLEERAFIPPYPVEEEQDIVDITLNDMNNYTRNLVMNELNLESLMIEASEAIQQEQNEDKELEEELAKLDEFIDDGVATTTDNLMEELEAKGYGTNE